MNHLLKHSGSIFSFQITLLYICKASDNLFDNQKTIQHNQSHAQLTSIMQYYNYVMQWHNTTIIQVYSDVIAHFPPLETRVEESKIASKNY